MASFAEGYRAKIPVGVFGHSQLLCWLLEGLLLVCPPFPGVDLWLSQRSGELSRYGLPNQNGDKVGDLLPTGILSEIGGASPHRGAKFRDCQSACGEKGRSVCVSKLIPSGGVSNNNSYKESMNKKISFVSNFRGVICQLQCYP